MAEVTNNVVKKVTATTIKSMKESGEKISMLTSYDFTMAQLVDKAGVDIILVGDSASNVMIGNKTTLPITVDEMIVFGKSVVNATKRAHVVIDMPFGSYQTSKEEGVRNAARIMKETGADSVKIEGGLEFIDTIKAIINAGIPVMAHLGLTPQSVNKFGGYGVRAKEEAEASKLISDAKLLDEAGCYAIVLEKIPAALTARVRKEISMPIIGIGAGVEADGQVLVLQDMLGMTQMKLPKFVRKYANLDEVITNAVSNYCSDVKSCNFPDESESY
ncbi:MAG: 3-methyl-2-oxobutanoate hydroxymethyltransferase [Paludibacteraceae bacterium]|nr:3-methyl-2-oxobutanoate hydroxymethyltransferase [Paludibacteraceae bacterium]